MVRVGVDIIEIARITRTVERYGDRFLGRVFTEDELSYSRSRPGSLAARWAAKEAMSKVLGIGWRGIAWREIEVGRLPSGRPTVVLHGRALLIAEQLNLTEFDLSLSHSSDNAIAVVIAS